MIVEILPSEDFFMGRCDAAHDTVSAKSGTECTMNPRLLKLDAFLSDNARLALALCNALTKDLVPFFCVAVLLGKDLKVSVISWCSST
jgi:hypothetical protein